MVRLLERWFRQAIPWLQEPRETSKVRWLAVQKLDFQTFRVPDFIVSDTLEELEKYLSDIVQKDDLEYMVFELKDCLTVKSSTIVTKCEKC